MSQVTPTKETNEFRQYSPEQTKIWETYREMRRHQTLEHVQKMHAKYLNFEEEIPVWEALMRVNEFVDLSDPDISLPNSYHLFQTAEAMRKAEEPEWFQVVGLIHDLGKILYLKGCPEDGTSLDTQWSIVGDTFLVGCRLPEVCVHPELNAENPDMKDPSMNTELGIYEEGSGLQNAFCSFGHDEYLYRLLEANEHSLPEEGLYVIRFHSLYPWHQGGAYQKLEDEQDKKWKEWVLRFNQYDLYTKVDEKMDLEEMRARWEPLLEKYLGKTLRV